MGEPGCCCLSPETYEVAQWMFVSPAMLPLDKSRLRSSSARKTVVLCTWLSVAITLAAFLLGVTVFTGSKSVTTYTHSSTYAWSAIDQCDLSPRHAHALSVAWTEASTKVGSVWRVSASSESNLAPIRVVHDSGGSLIAANIGMLFIHQLSLELPMIGDVFNATRAVNVTFPFIPQLAFLTYGAPPGIPTYFSNVSTAIAQKYIDVYTGEPFWKVDSDLSFSCVAADVSYSTCPVSQNMQANLAAYIMSIGRVPTSSFCTTQVLETRWTAGLGVQGVLYPSNDAFANYEGSWQIDEGFTDSRADFVPTKVHFQPTAFTADPPLDYVGYFRVENEITQCINITEDLLAHAPRPSLSCSATEQVSTGLGFGGSFAVASIIFQAMTRVVKWSGAAAGATSPDSTEAPYAMMET